MNSSKIAVVLAAMVAVFGCDSKDKDAAGGGGGGATAESGGGDKQAEATGPKKKGEPFSVTWSDYNFSVDGKPKLKGNALILDGTYSVSLQGFPKGTRWTMGDKKGATDSPSWASIKVEDMRPKFGDVPVSELSSHKLAVDKTINLVLPDGSHGDLVLPPTRVGSMDTIFKAIENGPVKFAGEGDDDPKPGLSILLAQSVTSKVFGQASKLSEVDAVARVRRIEEVKSTKTCGGYRDNNKKPMPDITLKLVDHEVVIYDRRKGGEIDKKTFAPDDKCPMFTMTSANDRSTFSSQPLKKIESWLRSKAK